MLTNRRLTYLCGGAAFVYIMGSVVWFHVYSGQTTLTDSRHAKQLITPGTNHGDRLQDKQTRNNPRSNTDMVNSSNTPDSEPSTDHIISAAQKVSTMTSPVLVSLVNHAYINMTYNWLCNTDVMGVHPHVLLLATDEHTKTQINLQWPDVSTVIVPHTGNLSGPQTYGHNGFLQLMAWRTEFVLKLLQANIEVLLFDTDIVWYRNVIPVMAKNKSIDFVGTMNHPTAFEINAGLLLFRPSEATLRMWQGVTNSMRRFMKNKFTSAFSKYVSGSENEQYYLNQAFNKAKKELRYFMVPHELNSSGKWYTSKQSKLKKPPIAIHNNWIVGMDAKVKRLKKFGQWFLTSDLQCDRQKVLQCISSSS
jgi:hypothetical protein